MRPFAAWLPCAGLAGLLLLSTLGEGGGSVASLAVWHAWLVGLALLALMRVGARGASTGLASAPLAAAASFCALALLGAARAPYAYAAILTLIELGACAAVALLAARVGPEGLGRLLWPLRIGACLHGVWALVQSAGYGETRPAATFLNPNHMAAWLVAVLLLGLGTLPRAPRPRTIALALAVPAAAALVLSGSRGGLLGFGAGAVVLAGLSWPRLTRAGRLAFAGSLVAVLAAGGLGLLVRSRDHDPFRYQRIEIWRASARAFLDEPLWGSGPGQFPVAAANLRFPDGDGPLRFDRSFTTTHSDLLRVPAELGFPATLAALGFLLAALRVAGSKLAGAGAASSCARAALAALSALATQALVDNPSRWPSVYLLASCLAGALLAEPRPAGAGLRAAGRAALAGLLLLGFVALDLRPALGWLEVSALPRGRLDPAGRSRLAAAIEQAPFDAELWLRRAEDRAGDGSDWDLDDYLAAREAAERAVRLQPADARYYRGLARVEALACRTLFGDVAARERARRNFELAELRSRHDPMIPLELAGLLVDSGDAAGARRAAERALTLEPQAVLPRLVLADALLEDRTPESADRAERLLAEAGEIDAAWRVRQREPYARELLRLDPRIAGRLHSKLAAVRSSAGGLDAEAAGLDGP